jgi:hypothetical protein
MSIDHQLTVNGNIMQQGLDFFCDNGIGRRVVGCTFVFFFFLSSSLCCWAWIGIVMT